MTIFTIFTDDMNDRLFSLFLTYKQGIFDSTFSDEHVLT